MPELYKVQGVEWNFIDLPIPLAAGDIGHILEYGEPEYGPHPLMAHSIEFMDALGNPLCDVFSVLGVYTVGVIE